MSDVPEPVQRILSSKEALDEFDFEVLLEHMLSHRQDEVLELIRKFPWNRLAPDQAMRFFTHRARCLQKGAQTSYY